ncbi:uncharacterized protein [Battus philenor]|uniref:uncharacterized protein n=1 Tax=Battus philenor TaxID=42288 RepID=UPI0035CE9498
MAFTEIITMINAINESIVEDMTCDFFLLNKLSARQCKHPTFLPRNTTTRHWMVIASVPHSEDSDSTPNAESVCDNNAEFDKHLEITKSWFKRISYVNKKLYLLALLEDVKSAWTLSLLLKSIWNCRPKDAVLSISGPKILSSYDQAPLDHNRTAVPVSILTQVMTDDRKWFVSLEPENQALALLELVTVAGGPVLWQVFQRAQKIYERYREYEIDNLKESALVVESPVEPAKTVPVVEQPRNTKRETLAKRKTNSSVSAMKEVVNDPEVSYTQAQKKLDESLAVWNATIKAIRDGFKLEEIETTFNDGTKKRIWKVDRPIPETTETVDFLQLLPSAVGKRILSYLPLAQLNEYSRVNKYWAYLIEELKTEMAARQKINVELEKLREIMLRNDTSDDTLDQSGFQLDHFSSQPPSIMPSVRTRHGLPSIRASQKSGHYSFRYSFFLAPKPIHNMADLYERLEKRGAADENIWKWCKTVSKQYGKPHEKENDEETVDDVLAKGLQYFPCPSAKQIVTVPLSKPLVKDPVAIKVPIRSATYKINLSKEINVPHEQENKRFSLWSRDFSGLYPASKIATYQSPI